MTTKEKMNTNRKSAIIVGVLFILATAAGIIGEPARGIFAAPNYLANLSANEKQVITIALSELIMAILIVSITFWMYPVLKKHDEATALGYVVFRVLEVVMFIIGVISMLTLLTLGQDFVNAGSLDAPYFQTLGNLLIAVREWGGGVCSTIVFGLSALMLNYVLYRSKLIPRLLSGWGFIGAVLYIASGFLPLFGHGSRSTIYVIMEIPLALNEMAFALWLIIKGFNSPANASVSAE
jgi:hypothetical protein